jgi:SagB-type dehydrogenase family enzyme
VSDGYTLLGYHESTKHSPRSVAMSSHRLDWSIKPLPFKIYRDLEAVEPPADIARLCLLSNGVLRWRRSPSGEIFGFRAAACTGALYHIELYLASAERDDLPAGLYHYGAHDGRLHRLRSGDVRGALSSATGGYQPVASAPIAFVLSSTFWRNAWKYQARAYRHVYWDGGAVIANLLAVLGGNQQPASVVMGFADDEVNRLLGLDGTHEAATAIVLAGDGAPDPPAAEALPAISPASEPLSSREVGYPEIEQAHRASAVGSGHEAAAWRTRAGGAEHSIPPAAVEGQVDEAIQRRRSARSFGRRPLTLVELEAMLSAVSPATPGDSFRAPLVEPFLIVNAVDGLAPGTYSTDLRPIRKGDFQQAAGHLALGQYVAAQAAVNLYFLTDLRAVMARLGERGYRVAQLAGGLTGGRLELAATAAGLAATGLTFFDDAVTEFLQPAAGGRQVMYLAALGAR